MPSNKATQAALAGNNLVIILMLVSFLVVGGAVLVGQSLFSTISLDKKILDAKTVADKQLSDDLANAPKLVDSYNALGSLSRVVGDALPTTQDIPGMLVTLENMSIQSGLRLKSVTPVASTGVLPGAVAAPVAASAKTGVSAPRSFRMSVAFEGSYTALTKFLTSVELSARPMKLVNLQLNGSGNSLTGQADVQTYYQDKATLPIVMGDVK